MVQLVDGAIDNVYQRNNSTSFFDCTNFYFEIDRCNNFRRKDSSKEKRTDSIVGLGLLLDRNCIPNGMQMYPGNESEKPVQQEHLCEMKRRNQVTGRTILTAAKGLNCAENIEKIKQDGDGYLYSKSILQLPESEKRWIENNPDPKLFPDEA